MTLAVVDGSDGIGLLFVGVAHVEAGDRGYMEAIHAQGGTFLELRLFHPPSAVFLSEIDRESIG